jgi:putative transposase
LYRAVDKAGNTVDFLLRAHCDKAAARRYFEKAIDRNGAPETVTMDKSGDDLTALQAINCKPTLAFRSKPTVDNSLLHCHNVSSK